MPKLLAPLLAIAALAIAPAAATAATTCPPGTSNPAYCTTDVPAAATDNAKETVSAIKKASVASFLKQGSLPTKVDAAGPGTVTLKVTAKMKGKTVVLGTFKATFESAASNTKVKIKLTAAGRKALKKQTSSVKLTVTSSFKPKGSKTSATKTSKVTLKK
jgi:hypothetical protein